MNFPRHSPTDRIGVQSVGLIFTEQLGWIFREQPISDIGVDATVETCQDGEATGHQIAVQIKTGESHFHASKSHLTLYVSEIHYDYWLRMNIPLLIVAFLPKHKLCYWVHASKNNFKKTSAQWKIQIPKKNRLTGQSASSILNKISFTKARTSNSQGSLDDQIVMFTGMTADLEFTTPAVQRIARILDDITSITNNFQDELNGLMTPELNLKDVNLRVLLNRYSYGLKNAAVRMRNETDIFVKAFINGFHGHVELVRLINKLGLDIPSAKDASDSLKYIRKGGDGTIDTINKLIIKFDSIALTPDPNISEAASALKISCATLVEELYSANSLVDDFDSSQV